MTANELLHYMKGFAELVGEPPTRDQWGVIRQKILETSPEETFIVDSPPMHNPISASAVIDRAKLPKLNCSCSS